MPSSILNGSVVPEVEANLMKLHRILPIHIKMNAVMANMDPSRAWHCDLGGLAMVALQVWYVGNGTNQSIVGRTRIG